MWLYPVDTPHQTAFYSMEASSAYIPRSKSSTYIEKNTGSTKKMSAPLLLEIGNPKSNNSKIENMQQTHNFQLYLIDIWLLGDYSRVERRVGWGNAMLFKS